MPKAKTLQLKWLALASLLNSTGAVSYTHLDVYKRQGQNYGELPGMTFIRESKMGSVQQLFQFLSSS